MKSTLTAILVFPIHVLDSNWWLVVDLLLVVLGSIIYITSFLLDHLIASNTVCTDYFDEYKTYLPPSDTHQIISEISGTFYQPYTWPTFCKKFFHFCWNKNNNYTVSLWGPDAYCKSSTLRQGSGYCEREPSRCWNLRCACAGIRKSISCQAVSTLPLPCPLSRIVCIQMRQSFVQAFLQDDYSILRRQVRASIQQVNGSKSSGTGLFRTVLSVRYPLNCLKKDWNSFQTAPTEAYIDFLRGNVTTWNAFSFSYLMNILLCLYIK